jgi:L-alanine-DL-glutamate epimerase-like enolase superfamily enzyme
VIAAAQGMSKATDIRIRECALYFLPVETRVPLKFGTETLTSVTCARVRVVVEDRMGRRAEGWGETPLNVQWVWPSGTRYDGRHARLTGFCETLAESWVSNTCQGHPIELATAFTNERLPELLHAGTAANADAEAMPWLAALVCLSAFDIAAHDAYGKLLAAPCYALYGPDYLNTDLSRWLSPAENSRVDFSGHFPSDYLDPDPPRSLPAWHLVGGLDPVTPEELTGNEPDDGYPVLLRDWIRRDGLTCLKIKLRGNDSAWDIARLRDVADVGMAEGVRWLTADFNCTVEEPDYVCAVLRAFECERPHAYAALLYVEQPFPYELEEHPIDVHAVSALKPLFLDESAHDWRLVKFGRSLGWTGVALKTCKTQSGALLALAWARAHGMQLMVQDLSNPMLAQIPHVQLAAHARTIMGVETNGMQFYPEASAPEARVHPGLYRRRDGCVALDSLGTTGFGYRIDEIERHLPEPATVAG